jgi:hypothetical protein
MLNCKYTARIVPRLALLKRFFNSLRCKELVVKNNGVFKSFAPKGLKMYTFLYRVYDKLFLFPIP